MVPGGHAFEVPRRGEPVDWGHHGVHPTKPMSGGKDTVPAMLMPGELVIPLKYADKVETLMEENGMHLPGFSDSEAEGDGPQALAKGGRVKKKRQKGQFQKAKAKGPVQQQQVNVKVVMGPGRQRRPPAGPPGAAPPKPPPRPPAAGPGAVINLYTYDNPFRGQLIQPQPGVLSSAALGPIPVVAARDRMGVPIGGTGTATPASTPLTPSPIVSEAPWGSALSMTPSGGVSVVTDDIPLGGSAFDEGEPAAPPPPPPPISPPVSSPPASVSPVRIGDSAAVSEAPVVPPAAEAPAAEVMASPARGAPMSRRSEAPAPGTPIDLSDMGPLRIDVGGRSMELQAGRLPGGGLLVVRGLGEPPIVTAPQPARPIQPQRPPREEAKEEEDEEGRPLTVIPEAPAGGAPGVAQGTRRLAPAEPIPGTSSYERLNLAGARVFANYMFDLAGGRAGGAPPPPKAISTLSRDEVMAYLRRFPSSTLQGSYGKWADAQQSKDYFRKK